MSRVGKNPVDIPSGVQVDVGATHVGVKGPKGNLEQRIVSLVSVRVDGSKVVVDRSDDSRPARANHGLMRALIQNMVTGVTKGFSKELAVQGIGYRADVKGPDLVLQLGYSHPITYPVPSGIQIDVDKQNNIKIEGIDRQQVGQVAAEIRGFRAPDHYKGKGVRYKNEQVRIKAGKSA